MKSKCVLKATWTGDGDVRCEFTLPCDSADTRQAEQIAASFALALNYILRWSKSPIRLLPRNKDSGEDMKFTLKGPGDERSRPQQKD